MDLYNIFRFYLRYILVFFILFKTNVILAQEANSINEYQTTLALLNAARKAAGLDAVSISSTLSKGCILHAKYLVLNKGNPLTTGLKAHQENSKLAGYSKEGEIAGRHSVIHFVKPNEAILGWIATFYHRIPLLQPSLREIGIGYYEKNGYIVTLIDCISGTTGERPLAIVSYPGDSQKNVPLKMGPENPDPVGEKGEYGFPITIYFTQNQFITQVEFVLSDAKNMSVECFVSTPEKPATDFTQWNTICAIPKKTLNPNSKYSVQLNCLVNKIPFKKVFHFQTGS
jgi:hypothetical protein